MAIHIGTSGWSYKHWKGIYYPEDLAPENYLNFYAADFSCVEINTSFYHLPQPGTVEHWMMETPEKFRFCPKLSRYVTHIKRLHDPKETLPRFFEIFDPYLKYLGPVLIQLPPNLDFKPEVVEPFLETLTSTYQQYDFVLEARHDSWLSEDAMEMLHQYKTGWVIADSGGRWPSAKTITSRVVYIRFHGKEGKYNSRYSPEELKIYADDIRRWRQERLQVWVFFNNDVGGYALENAKELMEMLQGG